MKFKLNDIVMNASNSFLGIVVEHEYNRNKYTDGIITVKVIKNDYDEFIEDDGISYFYDDVTFIQVKEFNSEQERFAFLLKYS
jgi:hypothetical protein